MECPIARALEEIGEGWTLLVLRDALLGARQFGEFEARLGIAASTLTRRLDDLVGKELLERRLYSTAPARYEYVPTKKGEELLPVLLVLASWGNRWLFGNGSEPILPVDANSGARIDPVVVDRASKRALRSGVVQLSAGPGASRKLRAALDAAPRVLGARKRGRRRSDTPG